MLCRGKKRWRRGLDLPRRGCGIPTDRLSAGPNQRGVAYTPTAIQFFLSNLDGPLLVGERARLSQKLPASETPVVSFYGQGGNIARARREPLE